MPRENNRKGQIGSTEVTIVIIVVVLILGGLSYALYRAISQYTNVSPAATSSDQPKPVEPAQVMKTGKTDPAMPVGLQLN